MVLKYIIGDKFKFKFKFKKTLPKSMSQVGDQLLGKSWLFSPSAFKILTIALSLLLSFFLSFFLFFFLPSLYLLIISTFLLVWNKSFNGRAANAASYQWGAVYLAIYANHVMDNL